ncbi:MAG: glycogenin glucosyltransferase [Thelocarpon impressellum]|nr:MAG: glycogenin glucosyltransferase [Thelocarpon impressellum]
MSDQGEDVYCTLLTSDDYLPGAIVLAHSLRDAGTTKQLAVLVTADTLQASTVAAVEELYDHVIPVPRIVNRSPANLYLMNRPDLHSSFTKINLWQQDRFRKIIYIDADAVVLRAPDELFELEASFAAAPDIGWPDCFNSGVMVLTPNKGDYYALLALAERGISFDGADQGLLNMHFTRFHRLSFGYNCTPSGHYQYVPAYRHFQSSVSVVHFIGSDKPWLQGRDGPSSASVYNELLGRWWAVYDRHFRDSASRVVRQYVKATGPDEAEQPPVTGERPLKEAQGVEAPTKGSFIAPITAWDPSRTAPPSDSRPEAPDFPQTTYQMSEDAQLFRAPAYAQPPGGLLYQVPQTPPAGERPKPIFPWEATAAPPTRVFDDEPPLTPRSVLSPPAVTDDETQGDDSGPTTPMATAAPVEGWNTFGSTNTWDSMPEIDHYISNISQHRRGKVQVLQGAEEGDGSSAEGRRLSGTKVTDFPTEIERPSLPVTPAPVRRPTFWGAERDRDGELPAAEGVPKQEDWDPSLKLEELTRHQPEVLPLSGPEGLASPHHEIPDRQQPESAAPLPTSPTERAALEAVSPL